MLFKTMNNEKPILTETDLFLFLITRLGPTRTQKFIKVPVPDHYLR